MRFAVYMTQKELISLLKGGIITARLQKESDGNEILKRVELDHAWFVEDIKVNYWTIDVKVRKPSWYKRIFA